MIREVAGNIWDWHERGHWVVVPTNGTVRADGACVMGRGLALEANRRFPGLARTVGQWIARHGNRVAVVPAYRLFTLPVKDDWRNLASIHLIRDSLRDLVYAREVRGGDDPQLRALDVVLPRVGCGSGGLEWGRVRPELDRSLLVFGTSSWLVVDRVLGEDCAV